MFNASGACGYDDLVKEGYDSYNTTLSTILFNQGSTCGACFEIWCVDDPQWCLGQSVMVTVTNFCPPNPSKPNDNGGWCNVPRAHFDLSKHAFQKIAKYQAGMVLVSYRRVPCQRFGGISFTPKRSTLFLVSNVGGADDVASVSTKGSGAWQQMRRNWGQN
ncbi:expansin-A8-like [Malania oleifera]|uniref:expansin-A8-like n=1 Tax=Malania oleifera TaxID=397392 RepID=UPI0025AE3EAF|nr:expansin-A8-like [Malania oleifera]